MPYGKLSHAVLSCKLGCTIKTIAKQRSHEGRIFSKSSHTFSVLTYYFSGVQSYMARVFTPERRLVYSWACIPPDKGLVSQVFSSVTVIFQNHLKTQKLHPKLNERVQGSKLEAKLLAQVEVGTKVIPDSWTNTRRSHHCERIPIICEKLRAEEAKFYQTSEKKTEGFKEKEQNTESIFTLFHEPMAFL